MVTIVIEIKTVKPDTSPIESTYIFPAIFMENGGNTEKHNELQTLMNTTGK